jgi:Xaa-Pro aminopeptidase
MSGLELEQPHGNSDDDATHVIDPSTEPIVMIDIGCKYRNQSTDVTRTFFFESATQEMLDAYSAVLAAQEAVITAMAPGMSISYLDTIIRGELTDYLDFPGVEFYPNWGHGVGFYVHELPVLNSGAFEDLEEGQILAVNWRASDE